MRNIIKSMAFAFGKVLSLLRPTAISDLRHSLATNIYTGYHCRRFRHWGKAALLAYRADKLIGLQHISVGEHTELGRHIRLTVWQQPHTTATPSITIGKRCRIGDYSHITAINGITIGDDILTGSNVLITDNAHGLTHASQLTIPPRQRPLVSKGKVAIGNRVWIGNNVCIMPGVTIGDGAVIAANSAVTSDIPPCCLAAGTPARVVKRMQ